MDLSGLNALADYFGKTNAFTAAYKKPDADAQERMKRSGGNDLLGKPFMTPEITVKALTFALRGRLQRGRAAVA